MMTNSLYCPCCDRRIRRESNLHYHLLTKHQRSELSAAIIRLLQAQQEQPRRERPLTPQ